MVGTSYGQKVTIGVDFGGLPEQICGATIRIDPTDYFYIEAFGSTRPLKNRSTGSQNYIRRESTVTDLSLGVQKLWRDDSGEVRISLGPYFQRKQFTGQQTCRFFAAGGCDQLLPERLDIKVIGARVGVSLKSANGLYLQAYCGLGQANRPSDEEVKAARLSEGVIIDHNGIFAHVRFLLGWQFNLCKKENS